MDVSNTRRFWLVAVACGCGAGAIGLRVLGVHSWRASRFDATAVQDGLTQLARPHVADATRALLNTISVSSLATVGGGLIAYALTRRRGDIALACATLLGGANITTQLLKHTLAAREVASAGLTHSFPSGHSTVAMSLALALLLVIPARLRLPIGLIGATYATAIGVALVVTAAHYPSDVGGGFFVAGAWAAMAALLIKRPATGVPSPVVLLGLGLVTAAAVVVAIETHPQALVRIQLHLRLVEAAVGIAILSAAVTACFAYAIALRSASATRS